MGPPKAPTLLRFGSIARITPDAEDSKDTVAATGRVLEQSAESGPAQVRGGLSPNWGQIFRYR